jgi:hypothetical protein
MRTSPGETSPSEEDILSRALVFAMDGLHAAELQLERAREETRIDERSRWEIDLQFFIVAIRRLRRGVEIGRWAETYRDVLQDALHAFDAALPNLMLFRDAGEHIDEYAVGAGNHSSVRWRQVQVTSWDYPILEWLDLKMNVEDALQARRDLIAVLVECHNREILAAKQVH